MSISPGSKIGPYEVTAHLGEGAMGVVYRAHDSRLQRDVALKILPEHFANDPERLSRFQREAQVLASLNHANIAQIYGLEQVNGSTCIVMELVEGETLANKLQKGPLSYDEVLDISRQLAEALGAAHERGIVHRDLKPANIKLTPNGTVKVLDFGLAKALGPRMTDTQLSAMPTVASGSIVGTVVGTPGYMSPEQARGKEVDARSDIWAFGCVVYEMLTAHQAFGGETIADVMAKIVASPPDLNLLPKDTPSSMRLLLAAALNKNASHRLQHIGDTRLFLEGPLASDTVEPAPARKLRGRLAIVALAAALLVAAIPAVLYFRTGSQTTAPQMRFEISFPDIVGQAFISPNGQTVVYVAQSTEGRRTLWTRPIGSETAQQVPGTEDISGLLWSPDSLKVAFVANGQLKKIDLSGGTPQILADVGPLRGGDWNRNGVILLARRDNIISRLSDSGGEIKAVTKLDAARQETLHALPAFLPDGKHFLYVALSEKGPEGSGIFLASLDPEEKPSRIIALQPRAFNSLTYVQPGYLLYTNNGMLTAQPLAADGRTLRGDPVTLATDITGGFSVSQTGVLMYVKAVPVSGKQLQWFNRDGKVLGQVGAIANYNNVDLSPKGDRVAVDMISNGNRDISVIDLARDVAQRITFDPGSDWSSSWSPDGGQIAFASTRAPANITQVYLKSSTGAGMEMPLSPADFSAIPVHWSPDGKYIVFSRLKANTNAIYDTWMLPLFGDRKPLPVVETPYDKAYARISPDSRWIAYSTNESGSYQIVVQTFPDASGGRWQISAEGGIEPKWRRDGHELYYLAPDGKLMAVSISGPPFQAGRPVALFQTPLIARGAQQGRDRRYDVATDGKFLMATPVASATTPPTTVVVNWLSGLVK